MKSYKASFVGLNKGLLVAEKKAIVSISIGQEAHEGAKFIATMEEVNKSFTSCVIAIGDTLQRYSFAALSKPNNGSSMFDIAKQEGDRWIARNIDTIESALTIDYKIKRWNEWIEDKKYQKYKKKVDELFESDSSFQKIVMVLAQNFYEKLKIRGFKVERDHSISSNISYLLEESAVACLWCDEGYNFNVYPSARNEAMNYSISKLNPKLVQNLLPIQIKFALKKKELSNTEWQKIIDTVPAHVYYKDVKGTVLSCNIAQASALGCSATDKVIGKDHSHFLNNEISEKHTYHDSEIALTKVSKIIEEETMIQGKEAWVLSHKAPMIENGKVVGIVGGFHRYYKTKSIRKGINQKVSIRASS